MKRRRLMVLGVGALVVGCQSVLQNDFVKIAADSVLGPNVIDAFPGNPLKIVSAETARRFCNVDPSGMCTSLTANMLYGFSEELISRLTREDIQQFEAARSRSIRTGSPETWSNPSSGARGAIATVAVPSPPPATTRVEVARGQVIQPPMLEAIGEPYVVVAPRGADVRQYAGSDFRVVDALQKGEPVHALGRPPGSEWIMVEREGVAIGYVSSTEIEPRSSYVEVAPAVSAPATGPDRSEPERESISVQVQSQCYTSREQVILADGTTEEAQKTLCRTPTGWTQL